MNVIFNLWPREQPLSLNTVGPPPPRSPSPQPHMLPTLSSIRGEGEAETPSDVIARMKAAGYVDFVRVEHSRSLVENPRMHALNLAYNPVAQILICIKCRIQVSQKCSSHVRSCPSIIDTAFAASEYDAVELMLSTLGAPVQLRVFEPTLEPRTLIEGLRSNIAYGCSACTYCAFHRSRVAAHIVTCTSVAHVLDGITVQQPHPNEPHIRVVLPDARTNALLDQLLSFNTSLREEIQDAPKDLLVDNPLVRFTRWHEFMSYQNVDDVRKAASFPAPDEFGDLYNLVLEYFKRASRHLDHSDSLALQLLESSALHPAINSSPLHRQQETEVTIYECSAVVTRLLATLLRRVDTGFDLLLPADLEMRLDFLAPHFRPQDAVGVRDATDAIHDALVELWMKEYPHPATTQSLTNPTLAFLCMQSVNADGSYMRAADLAGVLAHLTRAIRLSVVKEIHVIMFQGSRGPSPTPTPQLRALAGTRVDKIRGVLRWVDENNWSTYAAIRDHERYVRSLAGSVTNHQTYWWVDTQHYTEIFLGGHRLSLDHLRAVVSSLQRKIIASFQKLTAGLPTDIDYGALTDDLRYNVSGYSPVDLVWRQCSDQIMNFSRQLLHHPALGLTLHMSGELASNAVRAWLQALEHHELLTLAYVQLTCGGPGRTSEPVQLLMRNTPTRLRNLYVIGKRVCLVVRSDPSSSLRRHNELAIVSLDGFISDMVMRSLVFCRRPAEFLAHKLFPTLASEPARLYRDLCFTGFGRFFTSDDLSNAMGAESFPIVGFDLDLALFRTGFRAFNKQLVPDYNETGDADDADHAETIDPLHAGYAPEVGRQLRGLARNAFDGTPAALVHRNICNSDRWQTILRLQPGGRCAPYYQALAAEDSAPALDLQAPPHLAGNQLAQLLTTQMNNVIQAVLQQTGDLRVDIASIRAQIVPGAPPRAPSPALGSPSTAASAAPALPAAAHGQDADITHEEGPVIATSLAQDSGMSSSSVMQISSPSEDNPRASSLVPSAGRARRHSDASMAAASKEAAPSASWRDIDQVAKALSYTSENGLLKSPSSRPPQLFPRPDGMEFMNAQPYLDPYHVPPSDAICVARQILRAPNAQWKSDEQYGAIFAMAVLERDLCVVVRSGGGKSLAAVIPSFYEEGITIIMVPFQARLREWATKLDVMTVEYELFENAESQISGAKKVILVSVAAARLGQWKSTLFRLQYAGSVFLRIVIDDAHAVVTSPTLRLALREIPDIRFVNAPVVLLMSTMAPHATAFFIREYRLTAPLVVRGFTDRPEIQYNVMPSMDLPATAALTRKLWTHLVARDVPGDRFFVFVFSHPQGRELARLTELPFWSGASEDCEQGPPSAEHVALYARFVEGKPPGLIAFGELGPVGDYQHARFAVLVHPPPNLVLALHLCGRLSRDGRPGAVYIIPAPTQPTAATSPDMGMLQGVQAMIDIQYVMPLWPHNRKGRCVRRVVLEASDCISVCCYLIADAQLCGFCREFASTLDRDELKSLGARTYDSREPPPLRPLRIREIMPPLTKNELRKRLDQQFGGVVEADEPPSLEERLAERKRAKRYEAMLMWPDHDVCGCCYIYNALRMIVLQPGGLLHDVADCPHLPELESFNDFKAKIRYGPGEMICFTCHIPSLDGIIHCAFQDGDKHHPFRRYVLPMAWAVYRAPKLHKRAMATFAVGVANGHNWSDVDGFARWMSDRSATDHPCSGLAILSFIHDNYVLKV